MESEWAYLEVEGKEGKENQKQSCNSGRCQQYPDKQVPSTQTHTSKEHPGRGGT